MIDLSQKLVELGLNQNESKVLTALFSKGPMGATDINRHSGVPRNKVYEIVEKLASEGIVEVQPGRPVLYRAADPPSVIDGLVEKYRKTGDTIRNALHELEAIRGDDEASSVYAWVVRGRDAVKRKLAELIYGAKSDIFVIGGFPNVYLEHIKTPVKASIKRGLNTRAIYMVNPMETLRDDMMYRQVFEYRTVMISRVESNADRYDMKLMEGFRTTARNGCAAIFDETMAFNVVDETQDPSMVTGILVKAPGAPRIQKGTIERIMSKYTRKL